MLFGRRKRLEDISKAEAEGRSFWTNTLDDKARYKLYYIVKNINDQFEKEGLHFDWNFLVQARQFTLRDLGLPQLSESRPYDPIQDSFQAILEAEISTVFSLLEAIIIIIEIVYIREKHLQKRLYIIPKVSETICEILREHRIKFDLIDGKFVPFESLVMHEKVVVPTLTLLGSNKQYSKVEKAYKKALAELHDGSPDDAITDASTALQEALSALGCEGNSLGPLANSAIVKKVIDSHDKKLIDWVSADRSTKGDAHSVSSASTEDAWLTLHVVGAIILRICGGPLRSLGEAR